MVDKGDNSDRPDDTTCPDPARTANTLVDDSDDQAGESDNGLIGGDKSDFMT